MKALVLALTISSVLLHATPAKKAAKSPAPPRKAAAPAKRPPAPEIPPNATRTGENTWTHTDAQGKTWTYRRTPFGMQKSEAGAQQAAPYALPETVRDRESPFSAQGTPAAPPAAAAEELVATESGDSVTFQRQTPFGRNTWTKKKADLNDEERALLERAKSR